MNPHALRGDDAHHARARHGRRRHRGVRRWLMRAFVAGMVLLAAWLLYRHGRDIDWPQVRATLAAYPVATLAGAAALAAASYLLYGGYELLGRHYTHHGLPAPTVAGIAVVAYAFNLSLGPIIGAIGIRLRLYTRYGLRASQAARIMALSWVTNWSGYLLLAGIVLAARQLPLPPSLALGVGALQGVGVAMIALPLGYVLACARSRRREWHVRGHHFRLPGARMAVTQVAMSSANWALIGAVIWILMPDGVAYGPVLATLLGAAVAALLTHIPGGLGVLEGVFLLALSGQAPAHRLLAALLAYRAMYYLLPLALAGALFLLLEARAQARR